MNITSLRCDQCKNVIKKLEPTMAYAPYRDADPDEKELLCLDCASNTISYAPTIPSFSSFISRREKITDIKEMNQYICQAYGTPDMGIDPLITFLYRYLGGSIITYDEKRDNYYTVIENHLYEVQGQKGLESIEDRLYRWYLSVDYGVDASEWDL